MNQLADGLTHRERTRSMSSDDALVEIYRAHYSGLVRLAILLADDNAAAEDIVQDAFVKLHRGWGRLRDPEAALPYLRACVVNGGRSRLRRLRTSRAYVATQAAGGDRVAEHLPSAEHRALLNESHRELLAAVQTLPERQRQVLVLRYYAECTESETADTLGISVGAVKSHAHRAVASLGKKLEASR
jgi:RNA polymerase sigma-70 factor (sigma-E family)